MLVGGDVTRFFMGLMAVLGTSLRSGAIPVWNDLWGYGFPGLAESQMGVYYPPHLLLYGLFRVETAYVVSLVGHTFWGGLGAFWASRKFGISSTGSLLAAFSWSAGGVFVIHMSHPWGYSAGAWMPWAWGLAWSILHDEVPSLRRSVFLLSLVLVLQLLPGHFQIAFMTQVGIALMLTWQAWDRFRFPRSEAATKSRPWKSIAIVILALVAAFPLAAIQLWPTARLARLADQQRDLNYLAGFAATPFHLVSYVAPGLFHYAPSWRPLVWDPFITSPEEHLAYVGLVPLFLAITAMLRERKGDAGVRALTLLAVVSLILSLGPNVPGFATLIKIPGFSFFRAPARWGLPVSLALALLAGKGFDGWARRRHHARSIAGFVLLASLWIGAILGAIELSLAVPGGSDTAAVLRRGFQAISWKGPFGWDSVVAAAKQPIVDPNLPDVLMKLNLPDVTRATPSFAAERFAIYSRELGQTAIVLALFAGVAILSVSSRGRSAIPLAFLVITFIDLILLGRHRMSDLETAPWKPLTEQSPVLAELARLPRGTRSVDALRNFPMIAGLAPISAYRTMDLPVAIELTQLAHAPVAFARSAPRAVAAMRAAGAGSRTFDPVENLLANHAAKLQGNVAESADAVTPQTDWNLGKPIDDPTLAAWQYGSAWVARQGAWAGTYRLGVPSAPAVRAWLVDLGGIIGDLPAPLRETDASTMLGVFQKARPLATESPRPGSRSVELENAPSSGWLIVTELSDPQWTGHWIGHDGQGEKPARIVPVFHGPYAWGWMGIQTPGPGRWSLVLDYDAADVRQGRFLSAAAWTIWLGGLALAGLGRSRSSEAERQAA